MGPGRGLPSQRDDPVRSLLRFQGAGSWLALVSRRAPSRRSESSWSVAGAVLSDFGGPRRPSTFAGFGVDDAPLASHRGGKPDVWPARQQIERETPSSAALYLVMLCPSDCLRQLVRWRQSFSFSLPRQCGDPFSPPSWVQSQRTMSLERARRRARRFLSCYTRATCPTRRFHGAPVACEARLLALESLSSNSSCYSQVAVGRLWHPSFGHLCGPRAQSPLAFMVVKMKAGNLGRREAFEDP